MIISVPGVIIMILFQLSKVLQDFHMTQRQLSTKTGIRPSTVNDICRGKIKRLNIDSLDKICRALDCTTEDILEYIPDETYNELFKGRI